MTSEHARETVKTIDRSTVREYEAFLNIQKTVKKTKYIYIRYQVIMKSIYIQSFFLIPLVVSELGPIKDLNYKYKQRAITPKLGKAKLGVLRTALLLNEIHLPIKFYVHITCSCSFNYVPDKMWKDGWTYGRTKRLFALSLGSLKYNIYTEKYNQLKQSDT